MSVSGRSLIAAGNTRKAILINWIKLQLLYLCMSKFICNFHPYASATRAKTNALFQEMLDGNQSVL